MASMQTQKRLADVALGNAEPDLVLRGGRVVNVFTGNLEDVDVAVAHGRIAALGRYESRHAERNLDLAGAYVAPGFIDAHVHVESSHITPSEYARAVVPRGTVACVADPHELGNVGGPEAVRWFVEDAATTPLDVHTMVPSCVPASPFETPGAVIGVDEALRLRDVPGVRGLAEVMNYPGVLAQDPTVLGKIEAFGDRLIDGHAPGLVGAELCAYLAFGIASDHECVAATEAREKIARGMYVGLRQGSSAQNLRELVPIVDRHTARRCMLVDDDRSPVDLAELGHIDDLLRICVDEGVDPVVAISMATLTPAEYLGRSDLGAIAPGRRAHLVVLDDLVDFRVSRVFIDGDPVARDGEPLWEPQPTPAPATLTNTMNIARVDADTFAIPAAGETVRVIVAEPRQLYTGCDETRPTARDGVVVADAGRDIAKLAVLERHHRRGSVGLGLVRGLGMRSGAIASTMAHDTHDLIVCGLDDADMATAANRLVEIGGGFAAVVDGRVLASIAMPVAGIIADMPFETVAASQRALRAELRHLVASDADPFDTLQFMALTVIPELKLCDRGLVDVTNWTAVDLFV